MGTRIVRPEENPALFQRLLDFRHRDCPFPPDPPGVAGQFHDRRGKRPAGFTSVYDKRHARPKLLHHLLCAWARRKTGNVSAGPWDCTPDFIDQPPPPGASVPAPRPTPRP